MDAYDRLQELLNIKKLSINDEDELKKCNFIQSLLNKRERFFYLKNRTLNGILTYLGIEKEEKIKLYNELLSPENYKKYVPRVREIIITK